MDLFLYDVIGEDFFGEGLTAAWLRDELTAAGRDEPITLRINSPGGDVMESVAMATLLGEHRGPVDAKIDGLAASAATFLAASIDRVEMAEGGLYMIHDPWSVVVGPADEMRAEAELLDKVRDNLAAAYAAKSGAEVDAIREAMAAETWYTAAEAREAGLVDAVTDSPVKACRVPKALGYKHAPRSAVLKGGALEGDAPRRSEISAGAMRRRLDLIRAGAKAPRVA